MVFTTVQIKVTKKTAQVLKYIKESFLRCHANNRFECKDRSKIICYFQFCDGESDCTDGSDEAGCGKFLITQNR